MINFFSIHALMISRCSFQDKFTLGERQKESARVREKYNNKIPVIIEALDNTVTPIDKTKFLVPSDMTMGQLLFVVRKRIKLNSVDALFLMVDNRFYPTGALLSHVYENEKNEDGFLYVTYCRENTFG